MTRTETQTLEIAGVLPSTEALEGAVDAITGAGWDRSELSLLAQHHLLSDETVDQPSRRLAEDPEAGRQSVVTDPDVRQARTLAAGMAGIVGAFIASGATILTGGTALMAVVGAAVLGGGAAAAVEGVGGAAGRHREAFMREQLRGGGIVLWIKLHEPAEEPKAREILVNHGATDIHVHPVPTEVVGDPLGRGGTTLV
ncbi:MAG: hypothetical protein GC206_15270 [Alphaproteobacteria bacterium]|nr:hypothetical protein [Alphaproteobacteria bacterium]